MRISQIKIENLQVFENATIPIDDYTCIIGPNGSGKSTVLHALNIFFREETDARTNVASLAEADFHKKDTSKPIQITLTFVDLSDEAQEDFKHYYRNGELVVCAYAIYDNESQTAKVTHQGYRNVMAEFAPYFQAENNKAKVDKLQAIYKALRQSRPDLQNVTTKTAMGHALQVYESEHQELCTLRPSEDLFYGVSRAADKFEKYIQWVFIPAIKQVHPEQSETGNTALKKLLQRTVRANLSFNEGIDDIRKQATLSYNNLLDEKRQALSTLSSQLERELQQWAHADTHLRLEWNSADKSVQIPSPIAEVITKEGLFEDKLERFGHGLQRCYLFALLRVLSTCDDTQNPKLILGCEEPELFQHPPQLRHLAQVFKRLSTDNSQILLCTHSPYFVSGQELEEVRLVRKEIESCSSNVSYIRMAQITDAINSAYPDRSPEKPAGTLIKIHQTLQPELNELFFCNIVILVEGQEDNAFISTYLHLMGLWDDFRRLGCHIVPAGGKSNLARIIATAKAMNHPHYVIFDSDGNETDETKRRQHEIDNMAIHHLLENDGAATFPDNTIVEDHFANWKTEIMEDVKQELTPELFEPFLQAAVNCWMNWRLYKVRFHGMWK